MKKEYINYLKNYLKRESFYIDIVSVLLGLAVIVAALVAMIGDRPSLLKAAFGLALLLCALNTWKGFRKDTPTKLIYAGCTAVLCGVWIYAVIRL